ncbi:hypothetical protein [Alloactinosynnema sp. L-07]|uniref:hypothetical protein n=1 Tax=Alloactinosynnema sp. L-07 TaxID=1653480 RepID=UPI00065F0A61|nr:hypothetical protein [Alloactinosynnema sp. L-07]CRK57617.1 hypothetical protein [Alloactinosynnema sp. L-07]
MNEQQITERFRRAVDNEPPLGFGPDDIVDRAATARRRRTLLLGSAFATVAVVVAAVAVQSLAGRTGPAGTQPSAGSGSATVTQLKERAAAIEAHMRAVVPQVIPGVRDLWTGRFSNFLGSDEPTDGPNRIYGNVEFVDSVGRTGLLLEVYAPGVAGFGPDSPCSTIFEEIGSATCDPPVSRPDGSSVLIGRATVRANGRATTVAIHFRADGSVVWVSGHAYDPGPPDGAQPGPDRAEVPVSANQLVAIAIEPQLTVAVGSRAETMPSAPRESRARQEPEPADLWSPPGVVARMSTIAELERQAAAWQQLARTRIGEFVPGASSVSSVGPVSEGHGELNVTAPRHIGAVSYTLGGHPYSVSFAISAPGSAVPGPQWVCANSFGECTQASHANGFLTTERWTQRDGKHQILAVTHFRADGVVVAAFGHNGDPFEPGEPNFWPTIPVTVAQLTALATDPGFTL